MFKVKGLRVYRFRVTSFGSFRVESFGALGLGF